MQSSFNHLWTKLILLAVAVSPGFAQTPSVFIDGPSSGAIISGTVTVSGWAIDNTASVGTAIGSVQVMIDGVAAGAATYGVTRNDVCSAYPGRAGCPNVGFVYSLNAAGLSPGGHTITVTATDTDPTPDSASASVQVQVGPSPMVMIDSPTAGANVSGAITVSGWALDTGGTGTPIGAVQVLVDGVSVGTATYGAPRTDVCAQYPTGPGCPNVGYTFLLNTGTYSPGAHTITVKATDTDNNPDSGTQSVAITVLPTPTVMIDSLTAGQVVSGVVTVSGWAIDNSAMVGSAIGSVAIQVDGNTVGLANYGSNRGDVCAQYPGRPGCPNVGFTYMLDTRGLTSGVHTLTAQATDT
ncbi:MAG TPA: Ig-like domain-containing protein, partial [Bryobacteraceae bacterium]